MSIAHAPLSSPTRPEPADLGGQPGPLLAHFTVEGAPVSKKNSPIPVHLGLPRHPTERRQMTMPEYFGVLKAQAQDPTVDLVAELHRIETEYRLLILPNREYARARRGWVAQAQEAHRRHGSPELGTEKAPVMVGCIFYLGAGRHPDLLGLCEAAADLLQGAGWLANDYHVARWWQGTRRERDARRPRTEVLLWEWRPGAQQPLF